MDFIEEFEKDYKDTKWTTINEKIKKMLRLVFIACAKKYPEMQNDKSRAVYGIDIMIDENTMELRHTLDERVEDTWTRISRR